MKRLVILGVGVAVVAVVATATYVLRPQSHESVDSIEVMPEAAKKAAVSTLYCEFTNFADRNPLVGFYFTMENGGVAPVYVQVFQREQDGTQDNFDGASAPRPQWSYDGGQSPPVISSPDGTMQINLYDYDPKRPGSTWFEAGLRSIRYRNLGGKCRHSAA